MEVLGQQSIFYGATNLVQDSVDRVDGGFSQQRRQIGTDVTRRHSVVSRINHLSSSTTLRTGKLVFVHIKPILPSIIIVNNARAGVSSKYRHLRLLKYFIPG